MSTTVFDIVGGEKSKIFTALPLTLPWIFMIRRNGGMKIGTELTFTDEPQPPITLDEYKLLLEKSSIAESSKKFAEILLVLFEHSNWKQLHEFFNRRYKNTGLFAEGPKVVKTYNPSKTYRMPVDISTHKVGLPNDFLAQLEQATTSAVTNVMGDPFPAAVSPAIGNAYGFELMDIVYEGKDTKGRSWKDWVELFEVIEKWVRQIESTKAMHDSKAYSSSKNIPSDVARKDPRAGMKPEYIRTTTIRGVEGVKWVFEVLAKEPFKFKGFEDSLITTFLNRAVGDNIYARFTNASDRDAYTGQDRAAPPCPTSNHGQDWVDWIKSIPDGSIIVPKDAFEARWAAMCVMAYTRKTFDLKGKKETWDMYPSKPNFLFM